MSRRFLYAVATLLMIHGALHLTYLQVTTGPDGYSTGWVGQSWLLAPDLPPDAVLTLGRIWWSLVSVGFLTAGLGFLGVPYLLAHRRSLATVASLLSIGGFVVFWDGLLPAPWPYLPGLAIDVFILVGMWRIWPAPRRARADPFAT